MKVRSITAGAGTGKTTRITHIVRESITSGECRSHGIIGTTFTNKAANDLVERIRQELFKTGKIDLAERLAESLLGTVDSVCVRLLKRFAFEASISPDIQIIADTEAGHLLSTAIEDACSLEEIQTIRQIGERLCEKDGYELNWKTQIGAIAEKARENAICPEQLGAMATRSSVELLNQFPPSAPNGASLNMALARAIETAVQKISTGKDTTQTTADYLQLLRECSRDLVREELMWSQWVKLTKEMPAKASLAEAQPVLRAAECYETHPQLRADIEQYARLLFEFSARALSCYQELKEERGLLDFVDLEQRTLALLERADVASVIREEFDLLVVDEFQDTNPIQVALFIRLAALVRHGAVLVGDVKQAIYGFRGSDPALMNAVLANVTSEKLQTLDTTYRARPELVRVFNELFIPAFERELGLEKKDIELSPERAPDPELPLPLEFWVLDSGLENKNGTPKRPTNDQATQALAEGVKQLTANECKVLDRGSGELRRLQIRDIAILCRTNEGATTVAQALHVRGYPVTLGTNGLLATPEARLAMACLRRIAEPGDTLATAEIIALEAESASEEWLENRLEYLSAQTDDPMGRDWGLRPPLANSTVNALHEAHTQLDQLTPAEALDVALAVGNVFATASKWGPSDSRSAQRRANLEALRGLARQYERSCAADRRPTTVAGLVLWCDDLAARKADLKAADERADGVHVTTYHKAKGLEWSVVICAELDSEPKSRLWDLDVVQDEPFDANQPLANRRLRFWPWPFGKQQTGIPVATKIENGQLGREANIAAVCEELRLLYVGFTRARDMLVLVTRNGQPSKWLDLLKAPWLKPAVGGGGRLDGLLGPSKVPCCTKIIQPPADITRSDPVASYRWFPVPVTPTPKLPASIVPSKQSPIASAKVMKVINLRNRLPVSCKVDENVLGDALHTIFAAEFINPQHPDCLATIERILRSHGLDQNIKARDAADMVDRFTAHLTKFFQPKSIQVETPFLSVNKEGQRTSGFIDLLLETSDGAVLIDHKSFLGACADWPVKALSYSGQLAAYRSALVDRSVESVWIHFAAAGGLVQIDLVGAGMPDN
jgi:ATP-dependent helicase/nuclease subunit A